jgi:hypothetical protein
VEVERVTDTDFPLLADEEIDDLPRTLRREREARERATREEEARKRAATLAHDYGVGSAPNPGYGPEAVPAAVTRFDVPFFRLMAFFIKAVFAAIPALIILGALLWLAGDVLRNLFPWLVKMQILIRFPN